ncbi:MAG: VirB3 family type IV secretion system protein [Candidatus Omnitrophica bacterium]|nr:VirB3 family type IV secretion system protein [Candidatus Omnitrophota bacterium]
MVNQKKITPLFQSLTRPILMMGGERENIIICACISLMLAFSGRDFFAVGLAVIIWLSGLIASKIVARIDPWATKIFIKSLQYQDFYPARERINTPSCIVKRNRSV